LRKKKLEGSLVRSRAKWILEGEKPTKYFSNLENRNFTSKLMNSLYSHSGQLLQDQNEILKEAERHYKNLYAYKDCENVNLETLFSDQPVIRLSQSEKDSLEGLLTYSEMLLSLKKMSNYSSPGSSGFTAAFYKVFWTKIGHFLVRSINHAFTTGELSITQKQGIITLIPKGNKDKLVLKNWRPISLLNVSYKIASACIANRIKPILNKIISCDQTGFLPGRFIGENIRLIYDIMTYTEQAKAPGMLLLIDFAAAFDSLSWDFLSKVLDFFKFGEDIKSWIKLFYYNILSCITINGHLSEWFTIQRGCRQGDPLSPYLFIICAEILALLIKKNENITGVKVNGQEYLISQYADDTTLLLDGSEKSLKHSMNELKFYANISGLHVNVDKTKAVWIGSMKNSTRIICPELGLVWEKERFKILGITFTINLKDITSINYSSKIEEIKLLLTIWSKRILTPIGKNVVIKTLALPKLNHLILGLPNPDSDTIKSIQNIFFKFIWNNSPDKVKRSIMTQDYENGGIRVVNVEYFMKALKTTWLRRLFIKNSKYFELVKEICPFIT
jgi:Reverse transcriptase (RNA-dependent DNA polymerase)